MKRTLAIGDIHGGLKALQQVLQRAAITTHDTLIFLGDYVDGWSESAQVIDYLIQLSGNYTCIFIKGNHDVWCRDWLASGKANHEWLFHGGRSTVASYTSIDEKMKETHLDFFDRMKGYVVDDKNRLFIHAGFSSMHGPEREHYSSNFVWDRTLWETALTMDKRIQKHSVLYAKRLLLFHEIYIGHTPTLNYNMDTPMQGCNVWNIDTGAAYSGKLTCMDVDSKVYWQSDAVPQLYPNEDGRNAN